VAVVGFFDCPGQTGYLTKLWDFQGKRQAMKS
jgi:hypothetical protein